MTVRPRRLLAVALGAALPLGAPSSAAAEANPVPLSPCVSADNGDPQVTAVRLSSPAVDTTRAPAAVDVTVTAADTGGPGTASGVDRVTVFLVSAAGATTPESPVPASPAADGTWRARLTVPRGVAPGTYRPVVHVTDLAGHWAGFGPYDEPVPGDPTLEVSSVADTAAPALRSLRLSATRVDTRRRAADLVVTARVTDAGAGVTRVSVYAAADRRRSTFARLSLLSGTEQDGRWRGVLHIPRYVGDATWHITDVSVVDAVVNPRRYSARALAVLDRDHHVDRAFAVRSRADEARPTARPATFSTTAVDVSAGDQQIVVRVRARDDASGIGTLRLRLLDPDHSDGELDTYLRRVSGRARDGVWQATVTIPRCRSVAGRWTAQLKLTDRAGRTRQYLSGQPALQVAARDNTPPAVTRSAAGAGSPVLSFSEDVTGITAASAPVRDAAGTDVPGAWSCTDASGASVSCAIGTVRHATFTPQPAHPGPFSIVLNPEHSLGVTDLAGNPIGPRLDT